MKKDEPMRNINPFGLRLQPDMKARIDAAAAYNHRSINAEIVARLERTFWADKDCHQDQKPSPNSPADVLINASDMLEELAAMARQLKSEQKENE